ncbi:MAG: lipopolysaccharide heptosyltransferase II, partial [Candidatus Omnitrophica bacterium]|nr:lipopolysaccharide heptosyltransferase II [Candidatus Omnitrophota bacterium]
AGVPVVSTRVGGIVDIVEDECNGLLAAANDPVDLADKILRLYRDKELAKRLVVEARRRVEESFNSDTMMRKTIAVYEEAIKALNILVIKISAIGDCILSVPSLRAIRAKFDNANIKVLVGIQSRDVFDRCPYINDRIVCDLKSKDKGVSGLLRLARRLRKDYYDIIIDLQNNRKSHILAFLTYAPVRYGYDNGKLSLLLNRKVKDDAPFLDPIEHQFRTLKLAGVRPQEKNLELWPSEGDERRMEQFLKDNWVKPGQALVGINVRASSRWQAKNWPASHIAELCDRLAKEFNIRVVLTGSKEDLNFTNQILKATKSKPITAVGKTDILELACLIKRFKVYLTPDSAPMHIASAVATPFIALFGPTDPKRHIVPSGDYTMIRKDMKCSPCYSTHCIKNFKCMKDITVGEVFDVMKKNYLDENSTADNSYQYRRDS